MSGDAAAHSPSTWFSLEARFGRMYILWTKSTSPEIAAVRSKTQKTSSSKSSGTKLTFMPFFVRAAVVWKGLRARFPRLNSSVDGNKHRPAQRVQTSASPSPLDWGLIVPVIKKRPEGEKISWVSLGALNDLAGNGARARKKLKARRKWPEKHFFSITNPRPSFGGLFGPGPSSTSPTSPSLGLGTIEKRPVVIDDADRHPASMVYPHALLRPSRGGRRRSRTSSWAK